MAIRQRLLDSDTDTLPEDIDDLDAAYIQKMKDDGIDAELVSQFMDLMSSMKPEREEEEK
jgi:hypothetical protein